MSDKPIYITAYDLQRLQKLITDATPAQLQKSPYLRQLQAELDRAQIVNPHEVPGDVITMNSTICLVDLDTNEEETYSLVFPEDADIEAGKISILAPVGTALLGYRVGDLIEWPVPAGIRRLQIKQIVYQPEAAGHYDL